MAIWRPKIHQNARVKYIGIVEAIEADIKEQKLKPGDRLPAQRQIAQQLKVDVTTVTRAISEAAKRGLVETQQGSGCYIAQTAFSHYNSMHLSDGKPLDLSMNNPPVPPNICLQSLIADTLSNYADLSNHLCYQETAGNPEDRQAAAQWLSHKITNIDADSILIASGAHSAIFSVLSHLQRIGMTVIAAPEFCYPGLRSIAEQLGLEVVSVAMDEGGIQIASLAEVIEKYRPTALYITPNIDNPTTTTLSNDRREAIAELVQQYNIHIIEDDPYYEFLDKPLRSLYSLATKQTWHIATVAKCVSPALRVAYIVAPSVDQALLLAEQMRVSSIMAPPLMTAVVSEWIRTGQINLIAEAIKQENLQRQQLATSLLKLNQLKPNAAPHLWVELPKGIRALDFSETASRNGVSVVPSTAFVTTRSTIQAVRISLGVAADYDELTYAIELLIRLLNSIKKHSSFII
jgi:DNA-binding transcriptional MocR family regulator